MAAASSFWPKGDRPCLSGADIYRRRHHPADDEAGDAALRVAAQTRQNLLIVGAAGSGKTTLANAILAEPAFAADRVVLIEDTAELQCAAADKIEILTKRTEPAVTMTDLGATPAPASRRDHHRLLRVFPIGKIDRDAGP